MATSKCRMSNENKSEERGFLINGPTGAEWRTGPDISQLLDQLLPIEPPCWSYILLEVQVHKTQHIACLTDNN